MKKKSLATLLSGFLTVALTGVGFAAWVISGDDSADASGTIKVETVEDRRIKIVKDTSKTDETVVIFGQPTEETIGTQLDGKTPWLKASSDIQTEDLEATFNYKITNAKYATLSVAATGTLKGFIDDGYITMTPTYTYDESLTTETTLTLKLTFGWGTKFGGKNPYIYYNLLEGNETNISNALNDVNHLTAGNFTVTLTGTYTEPAVNNSSAA